MSDFINFNDNRLIIKIKGHPKGSLSNEKLFKIKNDIENCLKKYEKGLRISYKMYYDVEEKQ